MDCHDEDETHRAVLEEVYRFVALGGEKLERAHAGGQLRCSAAGW